MYLYSDLLKDMRKLGEKATVDIAGYSAQGRAIPYIRVGRGKRVLIHGGIHAREWITVRLVVLMAFRAAERMPGCEICFVPCVNPDGCEMAQTGSTDVRLLKINGSDDFSMWKANANAVDLNVNFDADWGTGTSNVTRPSPENYIGAHPESESETIALVRITRMLRPQFTVSYHALGRVVYWDFGQTAARERDRRAASIVADTLSYALAESNEPKSAGGYKDWCIQKMGIAAVTVEIVGEEHSHPLCEGDLAPEIERNLRLLTVLPTVVEGLNQK